MDANRGRIPRTARRCLAAFVGLLALMALAAPGAAAAPASAPAWQITAQPLPTNFSPGASGEGESLNGPSFLLIARNLGGARTEGEFKVEAELPEGLVLAEPAIGVLSSPVGSISCEGAAGERDVVCASSTPVAAGDNVRVALPVTVAAGETTPPSILSLQASVHGGGAGARSTTAPVPVTTTFAPFDFIDGPAGFYGSVTASDGLSSLPAGTQPFQMTIGLGLPWWFIATPAATGGGIRNAEVVLPRGFVVDPSATPVRCSAGQLERLECPDDSQVGTAQPIASLGTVRNGTSTKDLYNLVPAPGVPAEFGFEVGAGVVIHLRGKVRSNGEYSLAATSRDVLQKVPVGGVAVTFWGVPTEANHDPMRGPCGDGNLKLSPAFCPSPETGLTTARTGKALLTMPADCDGRDLTVSGKVSSWEEPDTWRSRQFTFEDAAGDPIRTTGCEREPFEPSIEAKPTTSKADTASGLEFDLHQRQLRPYEEVAPAPLKDATVTLPPGMTVNPASADGLEGCTEQQMGYAPTEGKINFTEDAQSCPDGAKLGTVSVTTPLLRRALPGAIYLAKPYENPFGSLLAIYLAIEDEETGIVSKLAGKVVPDPQTGQLTTTFTENPELPLEDIRLSFFGGNRASLQTPPVCGSYRTTSRLTPWSTPQGADATPDSTFQVSEGATGGGCPTTEAGAPNAPAFTAGTLTPQAGSYSPFVLKVSREDGTQRIGRIEATLPPGLTGKLAGIPYCPEADIAAAKAREAPNQGAAEIASPSCPQASEVGTVTVGAGAGPSPYYVKGRAYLAGPYEDAPLSLVIITPAVAGPFDLGTVVVRSALHVDPETAQISAKSDPIPTIIDGIPLDVRSVAIDMGRPQFTLNPTSCNPMAVLGSSISTLNQAAGLSSRFQVGGCAALPFRPKLKIQLKGATKRIGHPALKAVLTPRPGEANIGRAQVNLPHGEFLDQGNLNKTCTKPVLLAGNCPASTIYGKARAWTPLLDKPLEGNVYLVGGYGYKLPALVAELNGQIRILLVGKVDSGKNKGIRNTFEVVPDAPVSRFVLEMKGGRKYGLLENSENLCKAKKARRRAIVRFTGQNGKVDQYKPVVTNQCGKKHKKAKRHTKGSGGKH
jgi:hypothetical protein